MGRADYIYSIFDSIRFDGNIRFPKAGVNPSGKVDLFVVCLYAVYFIEFRLYFLFILAKSEF